MRSILALLALTLPAFAQEQSHFSQVMGTPRAYRVHLPNGYAAAKIRYPVIYWLHGYEAGDDERQARLAAYAATHGVIIVDSGPVEASGNYPLYLAELTEQVDKSLRTAADRNHRGVSGYGAGGFLALWQVSKMPDYLASASAVTPTRSAGIGPRGFEVDTVLEDLRPDYESVRTRLFNSDDKLEAALDFHLKAFTEPLPKPKQFNHTDPYPNFGIWGWSAISNRRRPGVTLLENVSAKGFRSVVREWLPGGTPLTEVKLTVTSAELFEPRTSHTVSYLRLADKKFRKVLQRADAQGRLTFDLDGGSYEVGIGTDAQVTLTGYEVLGAPWAEVGKPVSLRLNFWNKGPMRSVPALLRWDSPAVGVKFAHPSEPLPALAAGESANVPLTMTAPAAGPITIRTPLYEIEVPVYPEAEVAKDFKIVDETDHEGHASPGESFAVVLADGPAELITNDRCVDTSVRIVDQGTRHTQAAIRAECEPGVTVRMLARTSTRYVAIEFPIWYKLP